MSAYKRGLARTFVGMDRLDRIDQFHNYWGVAILKDGQKHEKTSDSDLELFKWWEDIRMKPDTLYAAVWNVWDTEKIRGYEHPNFHKSYKYGPLPPGVEVDEEGYVDLGEQAVEDVEEVEDEKEVAASDEIDDSDDSDESSGLMMGAAAALVGVGLIMVGGKRKKRARV